MGNFISIEIKLSNHEYQAPIIIVLAFLKKNPDLLYEIAFLKFLEKHL